MKLSWLYTALAISIMTYFMSPSFGFGWHIPGSEKAILRCGAVLLAFSLASLAALTFPAVRTSLREAKQRPAILISLAIVALYTVLAGSILVFPLRE
jgi:hypothetical protein